MHAKELAEDGDIRIYQADLFIGVGSGISREDGTGFAPGGGSPLLGHLS